MTREWMNGPSNLEVATDFGPVYISLTDSKHVYVDANSNGKAIVFRGKRYPMTFHFGLYDDSPSFQLWRAPQGNVSATAVYGDAPPSYKAKIIAEVLLSVNAYLRKHSHLLAEAEVAAVNNALRSVESEQAELVKKLEAVTQQANELLAKLEAARAALPKK